MLFILIIYMKLCSFQAKNVYSQFNFNVDFYPDVTILYGINGCGKTTVLNMINLIISGKFYDLSKIKFDEAVLNYKLGGENHYLHFKNQTEFSVTTNHPIIKNVLNLDFKTVQLSKKHNKLYENMLETFNKVFNAIFISIDRKVQKSIYPIYIFDKEFLQFLNRFSDKEINTLTPIEINRYYERYKREYLIYLDSRHEFGKRYKEDRSLELDPISEAVILISNKYQEYLKYCSMLDQKYQQESYKKMISLKKIDEIEKKLTDFDKETIVKAIDRIFDQSKYFRDEFEIPREEDFKRLINNFENEKRNVIDGRDFSGVYLLNFTQFLKLDELAELLEKNNQKKEEKFIPFKLLIDNLNEFFLDTKKKALFVDEKIKFQLRNEERIEPTYLSSGEKQILIFFTYLIFNEHNNQDPVILYDEPDLSLHLDWQEKFIDSVLKINPSIQIILATHSPGIGSERFESRSKSLENSFIGG